MVKLFELLLTIDDASAGGWVPWGVPLVAGLSSVSSQCLQASLQISSLVGLDFAMIKSKANLILLWSLMPYRGINNVNIASDHALCCYQQPGDEIKKYHDIFVHMWRA
ncbi:hypothetical protein AAHE18_05G101000 [Arachis hypogaea]